MSVHYMYNPALTQAVLNQHQRFVEKFGREPGAEDPLFFDETKDIPTPLSVEAINARLCKALDSMDINDSEKDSISYHLGLKQH